MHENYHAVPVVSVVRLSVATFASYVEAVAFDAVFVDEGVSDSLSTLFREAEVVFRSTCATVSITDYINLSVRVVLEPLSHVVDIDLFALTDLRRVDSKSYDRHQRSVVAFFYDSLWFRARELSFASSEFLTAFEEVGAKVVDLVVESSDLSHIVAFVECSPATSADVDVEAGDSSDVSVDVVAVSAEVPVVAVESSASFSEEVSVFAEAETELETCSDRESPRRSLDAVVAVDFSADSRVAVAVVDAPSVVTTETCEWNDAEDATFANATE